MSWLKKILLRNKKEYKTTQIPSLEIAAKELYGKQLSFTEDLKLIKVIYSNDKTKRFIILKSIHGFYKYSYEEIYIYDEQEWMYIGNKKNDYPAFWLPKGDFERSFFGTKEEAFAEMIHESEYINFFS